MSRRRGGQRGRRQEEPFAGLHDTGPQGLLVFGLAAALHRDDEAAAQIDEGVGLLSCFGDGTNLVDRYDAR